MSRARAVLLAFAAVGWGIAAALFTGEALAGVYLAISIPMAVIAWVATIAYSAAWLVRP